MSACSELLTFRLALLLLLGIILRYSLIFLERVADVLCRLVGQTVIVDSFLVLDSSATLTRGSLRLVFGRCLSGLNLR